MSISSYSASLEFLIFVVGLGLPKGLSPLASPFFLSHLSLSLCRLVKTKSTLHQSVMLPQRRQSLLGVLEKRAGFSAVSKVHDDGILSLCFFLGSGVGVKGNGSMCLLCTCISVSFERIPERRISRRQQEQAHL